MRQGLRAHIARGLTALCLLLCVLPAAAQYDRVFYYHTDALGSVVAISDENANIVERYEYEPYGQVLNQPLQDGPGYTGHVADAATGLVNMQQRYYDPLLGRFLSRDPISVDHATAWNFNRYNYGANNPYKYRDPDGRIIDTIADIGFIAYSAYTLYKQPSWTNAAALGADVVGAAVPFATGLGAGVRAVARADDAAKAATVTAKELRASGKADFAASRKKALTENGGKCNHCGAADATVGDHVKPLKAFANDVNAGTMTKADAVKQAHAPDNVVGSCATCNGQKAAKELSATPGQGKYVPPNPSDRIKEGL